MIEEKGTNKIQEYLIRIISRFFESERIDTESSVEAIVVESLRRLHETMAAEINYVFSVNAKTGKVILNPYDIGAEAIFKKKTAFNADFGSIAGTILEGDSNYLSDERIPLNHGHFITNINDLELKNITYDGHIHKNKEALDLLRYAGTSAIIDLIIIEKSKSDFKYTIDAIQKELIKMEPKRNDIVIQQKALKESVFAKLEEYEELCLKLIEKLKKECETLIDSNVKEMAEKISSSLIGYTKKDFIEVLQEELNKAYFKKEIYSIDSANCQKFVEIKTATLAETDSTKDLFASVLSTYEFEIPETGEIEINIKATIDGKTLFFPGCYIAASDGFYGDFNYETSENRTKIKVCIRQSKTIYNIPNDFIAREKKIFALSQEVMNWEDSVTNIENGFGKSMATIDDAGENSILSSFNNAWIRTKNFNDEWVWYNGPVEEDNQSIIYSNWKVGEPSDDVGVFNPTGWTTGNETDLKKSIIEWKFETPDDICDSIIFIVKVRKE